MEPNLCIPRMPIETSKTDIYNTLNGLNWGKIHKLIEIPLKNDAKSKRIIIKLKWNVTEEASKIKQDMIDGKAYKIVHDMPWYWKIMISTLQVNNSQTQNSNIL